MLIKYVYIGLPTLLVILFLAIVASSYMGAFSVLEEDLETTKSNALKGIGCFAFIIVVAIMFSLFVN